MTTEKPLLDWDQFARLGVLGVLEHDAERLDLRAEAIRLGMQTLRMAALNKFKEGVTTIEEVTRTSASD